MEATAPPLWAIPLACAVAVASINLLLQSNWQNKIADIEQQLRCELEPAQNADSVADVRVLGAIGVLEMSSPVDMASLQKFFLDQGVWIRPFSKLIYLMPPYTISSEDLSRLTGALLKAADLSTWNQEVAYCPCTVCTNRTKV
ncbi:Aminotransferase class-III [Candidatus Electrothrix communis]|uniref:Aminotransferase class-III n=1 Tax=Candidatus Electrothrix communis TaxID=1859133 RepID=A0A3S3QJ31_9BACT|nr:Aminotransferase class-III [Candidatus Electrothrix communis]